MRSKTASAITIFFEGDGMPRSAWWALALTVAAAAVGISLRHAQRERRSRSSGTGEFLAELLELNQSVLLVSSCVPSSTTSMEVARLARRMARDHAWLGRALKRASGLRAPTGMEDGQARALVERFDQLPGEATDNLYVGYLVETHRRATALCELRLREETPSASRVARDALAMLSEHAPLIEQALQRLAAPRARAGDLRVVGRDRFAAPDGFELPGNPHA
jgi:uncharacterized protein DUF4142